MIVPEPVMDQATHRPLRRARQAHEPLQRHSGIEVNALDLAEVDQPGDQASVRVMRLGRSRGTCGLG